MILTRRQMMQGLAYGGASMAMAPFLRSVAAHAAGDPKQLPKRFVFVVKSSGLEKFNLVPGGIDNAFLNRDGKKLGNTARQQAGMIDVPLSDHALPEKLAPLKAFKQRMTILQSLSGEGFTGNHTAGYGALSCHNSEKVAIAPSIDCMLGQQLSAGPYPVYGMAMNGRLLETGWKPDTSYCYPNISAYKKGMPLPYQASPRKAFLELFGTAVASPEALAKQLALIGSMMDFLREDAKRVERQLSAEDKERFERYTAAFESIEQVEKKKAGLADQVKRYAPKPTVRYDSIAPSARIESHFEIATAALIAGLTNVITLRPDTLGVRYTDMKLSESVHALGHMYDEPGSNGWTGQKARAEIEALHLGFVAKMAKQLDDIPEGDGTMLDNTLIVYTSCAGGDHHGGQADWPFILLGGIADRLRMGRYIQYPKYQDAGHRTIGNLYLTLMHAAGLDAPKTFGQLDSKLEHLDLNGPLSELMTI